MSCVRTDPRYVGSETYTVLSTLFKKYNTKSYFEYSLEGLILKLKLQYFGLLI